jgi:hypothetical protein
MGKKSKPKHRGVSNPEAHQADMERRRSSAASPQESRDKRLRTKQAVVAREVRDAGLVPA